MPKSDRVATSGNFEGRQVVMVVAVTICLGSIITSYFKQRE